MFLEQQGLTSNPFHPSAPRTWFQWASARQVLRSLDELIAGKVQCVLVSGSEGIGKSTLIRWRMSRVQGSDVAWISPGTDTPEALLAGIIRALGLGAVEGTLTELRNIVAVYLRHQTGQSRPTFIVADDLERLPLPVREELDSLAQLRLRHRPVAQWVLSTADATLAASWLAQLEGDDLMRALHQPLGTHTLEETRDYIHASLRQAGSPAPEALFPAETIIDVQAFTRGAIRKVNALCGATLETLAARPTALERRPRVTRALLKEVGGRLGLQYDASAWAPPEGGLPPEAVTRREPALGIASARLLVWSGGVQIAEIVLDRPRMVLGRDGSCDISMDSGYVSRYQNLFMDTGEGWMLFDLNSTNGCHVNGRRVREHLLRHGDLIAVGHHQIRFVAPHAEHETPGREPADETMRSPSPLVRRSP